MPKKQTTQKKVTRYFKKIFIKSKKRFLDFLSRRPHRTFRMTRRRDYIRTWQVPGYWAFTNEVRKILWSNKWLFSKYIILYSALSFLILGLMSDESYDILDATINQIGGNVVAGELSMLVQDVAVFAGVFAGAFDQTLSEGQQIYGLLLALIGWLTVVWLLRQILAGHKQVRLRDALYSCAAPLIATSIVACVVVLQLIPFAIAVVGYGAALAANIFSDPLLTILFWVCAALLITLSLFWITSSLIAMVVVTLPGMYPLRALKVSGDLVTSRRLRILYRYGWLALSVVVIWAIILLPGIILSRVQWLEWLPIVPLLVLLLSAWSILWGAAYVYLLYRKLVSDDTKPA